MGVIKVSYRNKVGVIKVSYRALLSYRTERGVGVIKQTKEGIPLTANQLTLTTALLHLGAEACGLAVRMFASMLMPIHKFIPQASPALQHPSHVLCPVVLVNILDDGCQLT